MHSAYQLASSPAWNQFYSNLIIRVATLLERNWKRATIFRNVQLLWFVSFLLRKFTVYSIVGIKSLYVSANIYDYDQNFSI